MREYEEKMHIITSSDISRETGLGAEELQGFMTLSEILKAREKWQSFTKEKQKEIIALEWGFGEEIESLLLRAIAALERKWGLVGK